MKIIKKKATEKMKRDGSYFMFQDDSSDSLSTSDEQEIFKLFNTYTMGIHHFQCPIQQSKEYFSNIILVFRVQRQ